MCEEGEHDTTGPPGVMFKVNWAHIFPHVVHTGKTSRIPHNASQL